VPPAGERGFARRARRAFRLARPASPLTTGGRQGVGDCDPLRRRRQPTSTLSFPRGKRGSGGLRRGRLVASKTCPRTRGHVFADAGGLRPSNYFALCILQSSLRGLRHRGQAPNGTGAWDGRNRRGLLSPLPGAFDDWGVADPGFRDPAFGRVAPSGAMDCRPRCGLSRCGRGGRGRGRPRRPRGHGRLCAKKSKTVRTGCHGCHGTFGFQPRNRV
jgi:hypothetical protein